jgi:hypothetical protein
VRVVGARYGLRTRIFGLRGCVLERWTNGA